MKTLTTLLLHCSLSSFLQLQAQSSNQLFAVPCNNLATFNFINQSGHQLIFERDPNGATASWQTTAERNTSHFELQMSFDDQRFESFKTIAASDITNWKTNYEVRFRKTWLSTNRISYRVRTVFTDGTDFFSTTATFKINTGKGSSYAIIH